MESLNKDTFKSKVFNYEANKEWKFEGEIPVIIDFYADWCGPCKALAPVLEKLSHEYKGKIEIYKVDTEANPELASLFHITSIPSLLFVPKTGKPSMAQGFLPEQTLKQGIKEVLKV